MKQKITISYDGKSIEVNTGGDISALQAGMAALAMIDMILKSQPMVLTCGCMSCLSLVAGRNLIAASLQPTDMHPANTSHTLQ